MTAYRLSEGISTEIERALRDHGSILESEEWSCWVQFFYQQYESIHEKSTKTEMPAFAVIGIDSAEFVIGEKLQSTRMTEEGDLRMNIINLTEVDARVFEKMSPFNIVKKSPRRIKYVFKRFRYNDVQILLDKRMLILSGTDAHGQLRALIPPSLIPAIKSLGVDTGFARPRFEFLNESARCAFWLYCLTKVSDRVFSFEGYAYDFGFKDCLFARNYALV
jgi:hypothetical protein